MTVIPNWFLPPSPPPVPTRATSEYVNVLKEADKSGLDSTAITESRPRPDGQLSQQELQEYQAGLQQQISMIGFLGYFFTQFLGPQVGQLFQSFTQALQNKLAVAKTMSDNYDKFANPNNVTHIVAPQISETSINQLSEKDGNAANISDFDIKGNRLPVQPDPLTQTRLAKIARIRILFNYQMTQHDPQSPAVIAMKARLEAMDRLEKHLKDPSVPFDTSAPVYGLTPLTLEQILKSLDETPV